MVPESSARNAPFRWSDRSPTYVSSGLAVQELRDEKGMKKAEFAEAANLDVAHMSRAQNHGRNFTWQTLTLIAEALDIGISVLVLRAEAIASREADGR